MTSIVSYGDQQQIKLFAENHPAFIDNDDCVKFIFTSQAYFFDVNCPKYGCRSGLAVNTCAHYV
jgi:hypothetical protein